MISPFSHILGTNYSPSDAEVEQIKKFCSVPERKVEEIDGEIQRHRDIIDKLNAKRSSLQKLVDAHRALLSPMRRISVELLQRIFTFCLPSDRNPMMHHSDAPILLGRVCSHWRRVAYTTVELWSALHLVIPSSDQAEKSPNPLFELRRQAVRVWLNRSGECLLSISIYSHHSPSSETDLMLSEFVPFYRRLRSLALDMGLSSMDALCTKITGNSPNLQNVAFKFHPEFEIPSPIADYDMFQFLFTQKTLRRFNLGPGAPYFHGAPPTGQSHALLSSLIIGREMPSSSILTLLSALPNLEECSITCCPPPPPSVTPQSITLSSVSLLKLTRMAVCVAAPFFTTGQNWDGRSELVAILDKLFTPSLREFDYLEQNRSSACSPVFNAELDSLMCLLERSATSLHRLALRHGALQLAEVLETYLARWSDLSELTLQCEAWFIPITSGSGDRLLTLLKQFCPKLVKLTFVDFVLPLHIDYSSLVSFVKEQHLSGLRQIQFVGSSAVGRPKFEDPSRADFQAQIQTLRLLGLDIVIEKEAFREDFLRASPWLGHNWNTNTALVYEQ